MGAERCSARHAKQASKEGRQGNGRKCNMDENGREEENGREPRRSEGRRSFISILLRMISRNARKGQREAR